MTYLYNVGTTVGVAHIDPWRTMTHSTFKTDPNDSVTYVYGEILLGVRNKETHPRVDEHLAWTPVDLKKGLTLRVVMADNRAKVMQVGRFLPDGAHDPASDLVAGTITYRTGQLSGVLFAYPLPPGAEIRAYYHYDWSDNNKTPPVPPRETP